MKLLKSLVIITLIFSLTGCGNQGNNQGNEQQSSTSSSTSNTEGPEVNVFNGTDDILAYLSNHGFMVDDIMEISDLDSGYLEGRRFINNGMNYSLYRYDKNDTSMMDSIKNAQDSSRLRMKVNGEYVDVLAYIYDDYVLVYPEDANVDDFSEIFDNINK